MSPFSALPVIAGLSPLRRGELLLTKKKKAWFFLLCDYQPKILILIFLFLLACFCSFRVWVRLVIA
jgi:hypothetical protein